MKQNVINAINELNKEELTNLLIKSLEILEKNSNKNYEEYLHLYINKYIKLSENDITDSLNEIPNNILDELYNAVKYSVFAIVDNIVENKNRNEYSLAALLLKTFDAVSYNLNKSLLNEYVNIYFQKYAKFRVFRGELNDI